VRTFIPSSTAVPPCTTTLSPADNPCDNRNSFAAAGPGDDVVAMCNALCDNIDVRLRGDRALLLRHGRRFLLSPESISNAERFFDRHDARTVFVGRFITGLQLLVAFLAGAHRTPWKTFFLWNVLGAIAWSAVYAGLGYAFGANWNVLDRWVGDAGLFVLAIIGLAVVMFAVHHREWLGRRLDKAIPSTFYKRSLDLAPARETAAPGSALATSSTVAATSASTPCAVGWMWSACSSAGLS